MLFGVKMTEVDELLRKVGLYDSRNKVAEKLSTGMKQRMLLVRALINRPKLLFLDEQPVVWIRQPLAPFMNYC